MNILRPPTRLWGFWVATALMTGCSNPGYNDNPSQQIANGRVGCLAATEFFAVYFNVHIQPFADRPDARLTKEVFRSYCEDLPMPGTVFFTADLVGNELRKTPIGIRVVEREAAGFLASPAGEYQELRVLSERDARPYAQGVIELQFDIDRNGYYAVDLIRGGEEGVTEPDILNIPLHVGVESGASLLLTRIITLLAIAAGMALTGMAAFRLWRRLKIR